MRAPKTFEDGTARLDTILTQMQSEDTTPVSYTHLDVYKRQTLAGLVVVLSILVKQISALFVTIKSLFAL